MPTAETEPIARHMVRQFRDAAAATLVSMTPDGLFANHAPVLLDPDHAAYGSASPL